METSHLETNNNDSFVLIQSTIVQDPSRSSAHYLPKESLEQSNAFLGTGLATIGSLGDAFLKDVKQSWPSFCKSNNHVTSKDGLFDTSQRILVKKIRDELLEALKKSFLENLSKFVADEQRIDFEEFYFKKFNLWSTQVKTALNFGEVSKEVHFHNINLIYEETLKMVDDGSLPKEQPAENQTIITRPEVQHNDVNVANQELEIGQEPSSQVLTEPDIEFDNDTLAVYKGAKNQQTGLYEGIGCKIWPNGSTYQGYFKNGVFHNYGFLSKIDNESYKGHWFDGKMEGQGETRLKNGTRYRGQHKYDGLFHGRGELFKANGDHYKGPFIRNNLHGKNGVYTFKDGRVYQGTFIKNQMSGPGTMKLVSGTRLKGEFVKGVLQGNGIAAYSDGSKYIGQFNNGLKHGNEGSLKLSTGTIYTGEFKDDHFSGRGKITYHNGDSYIGYWLKSRFHKEGVYKWNQDIVYSGEFKNGFRHGKGTLKWGSCSYTGDWAYDKPHGRGRLSLWNSMSVRNGIWIRGYQVKETGEDAEPVNMDAMIKQLESEEVLGGTPFLFHFNGMLNTLINEEVYRSYVEKTNTKLMLEDMLDEKKKQINEAGYGHEFEKELHRLTTENPLMISVVVEEDESAEESGFKSPLNPRTRRSATQGFHEDATPPDEEIGVLELSTVQVGAVTKEIELRDSLLDDSRVLNEIDELNFNNETEVESIGVLDEVEKEEFQKTQVVLECVRDGNLPKFKKIFKFYINKADKGYHSFGMNSNHLTPKVQMRHNVVDAAKQLFSIKDSSKRSIFLIACWFGHYRLVHYFLNLLAFIQKYSGPRDSAGKLWVVKYLHSQDESENNCIDLACMHGFCENKNEIAAFDDSCFELDLKQQLAGIDLEHVMDFEEEDPSMAILKKFDEFRTKELNLTTTEYNPVSKRAYCCFLVLDALKFFGMDDSYLARTRYKRVKNNPLHWGFYWTDPYLIIILIEFKSNLIFWENMYKEVPPQWIKRTMDKKLQNKALIVSPKKSKRKQKKNLRNSSFSQFLFLNFYADLFIF